jgi:diacylglycerol kinase (ATP)
MPWTVIVNPAAGRGRTRRLLPELTRTFDAVADDVIVEVSSAPGEPARLAGKATSAGRDVVACGGDGVVSEVAGVATEAGKRLAIVPTGAGNDFARALGIRGRDPRHAVEILRTGREAVVDLGRVVSPAGPTGSPPGGWFTSVANTGFDAEVNRWANGVTRISGTALYVAGVARTLAVYRPRPFRVRVDDCEPLDSDAWLIAIGNGPIYGGGMRIAPDARLDDGALDVCLIGPLTVPKFTLNFPRVFRGTHVNHPAVTTLRGRVIEVEALDPRPMDLYAAGERVGPLPARVEAVAGALRLVVPTGSDLVGTATGP